MSLNAFFRARRYDNLTCFGAEHPHSDTALVLKFTLWLALGDHEFLYISVIATVQEFKVTTMQNSTRCEICKVDTPDKESLACHILGKKHLRKLQHLQQKKDAEETGIYVTGLFSFVFYLF